MIRYLKGAKSSTLEIGLSTLFIHGFLGRETMWSNLYQKLSQQLVGIDGWYAQLPGHGPNHLSGETDWDYSKAVAQAVDALPFNKGFVVAYSMGARLALGMLLAAPHRFFGGVLLGVHPGLTDSQERKQRQDWDKGLQKRLGREGMRSFVEYWQELPLFASQNAVSSDAWDEQRRMRLSHEPEQVARSIDILGLGNMPPQWEGLAHVKVPLCVVAGGNDTKFLPIAKKMALMSDNIELQIVPGAGHNPVLELPEAFGRTVYDFITMHRKKRHSL